MRSKSSHNRSRSLSDPLALALLPPQGESPIERDTRIRREQDAKKVSDDIDEQIRQEKAELRKQKHVIKVLLLGQSESGKSTTLKQFQLLHTPSAFHAERIAWRAVIYLNLIRSVRRILEALSTSESVHALLPSSSPSSSTAYRSTAEGQEIDSFLHFDRPPSRAYPSELVLRFERYRQRLAPLLELEQRLTRQLSFPDEDDDPPQTETKLASPIAELPPHIALPLPASVSAASSLPISSSSRAGAGHNVELTLRPSSNWKKSFSFRAAAQPKSAHGGELRGWWEDPRDPVHVLHGCAGGEYGIRALWKDPDVRQTLARRRVRMEESAGFYLNDVERITALKYIPTDDDVLRARLKTVGVIEHTFAVRTAVAGGTSAIRTWRIYDVGGARNQRQAWAPYFDDVNAIIFLVPISAFDQALAEDPRVNRLEDSMLLWRSVVSNKLLSNVNIVLFLNKCDLLKAKLDAGISLAYHMVSYGDKPNDYESVSKYFKNKFSALHKRHTSNSSRHIYIYLTSVTDKHKTAMIISSVSDILLAENLAQSRLL